MWKKKEKKEMRLSEIVLGSVGIKKKLYEELNGVQDSSDNTTTHNTHKTTLTYTRKGMCCVGLLTDFLAR